MITTFVINYSVGSDTGLLSNRYKLKPLDQVANPYTENTGAYVCYFQIT